MSWTRPSRTLWELASSFDINEPSEYVQTTLGEHLPLVLGIPMVDVRFSSLTELPWSAGLKLTLCCSLRCADQCIDQYVALRNRPAEVGKEEDIDQRLVAIVERLFER